MTASLFKDLARSGWHSSIMTTYSVDPAFYDGSIDYRLRTYGCKNNILMADAVMLKRALNATPEAFKNAGRRYAVVPVQVTGCFHPKVHLRLGIDSARLVVGSANATAAGWGSNHEIVTAIDWRRKSDDPAIVALGPIIRRTYDYLAHWLQSVAGDAIDFKLRLHRRDTPWLNDLETNNGPIALPDGSAIDIFCEQGGNDQGMLSRLTALTDGEKALRLVVISPYWDSNLGGLRELQEGLSGCSTVVALNPTLNEFPVDALEGGAPVIFAAIHDGGVGHRFLHAKVILIETDRADHVLFGSANCSDDAMGGVIGPARNAEVSIYRRFPPGDGLKLLGLDLSRIVDRSMIRSPEPNKLMFQSGLSSTPAGSVEVVEKSLTWWPPASADTRAAIILIGEESLPTVPIGNGQFRTQLSANPAFPLVVRIQFRDGRISDPIIVHDETALRMAAPGVTDRRLQNAFNRVLRGEEDIIDLALQAHLLFEPASDQQGHVGRANRNDKRSNEQPEKQDYATPEEFRHSVLLKPANGQSGRFGVEDPGLLDLLTIILRGVTDVGGREARRRQDEEEDADLQAGESEDGDELNETTLPQTNSDLTESPANRGCRLFTSAEIERRKSQLKKAIDAFETMLAKLSAEPAAITNRLTAQTAFILNLMVFACTKEHPKADGSSARLMAFTPGSGSDRELTFAVRVGRILQTIWVGGHDGAIVDKLEIDRRHESVTDDVFYLIVMSRWAIARACLAVMDEAKRDRLGKILQNMAVKVYQSSARFGPLDAESEHRFISKLDESVGFTERETRDLIRDCQRFVSIR
jgi:hypothetical protein